MLAWIMNLDFAARSLGPMSGPFKVAQRQTFGPGADQAETYAAGLTKAQTFTAGATAGETRDG